MFTEKQITAAFSKWLRKQRWQKKMMYSFGIEFKVKRYKKRLNFKCDFRPQQLPSLLETKYGCIYKKYSDMDISTKHYDASQICFAPAYVACLWYRERKPKILYLMDIDDVYGIMDTQKSMTEDQAKEISEITIKL